MRRWLRSIDWLAINTSALVLVLTVWVLSWAGFPDHDRYDTQTQYTASGQPDEFPWWESSAVWTAIFTGLLTISTVGLWIVTRTAANAAAQTVRTMQETAERQLRAYVYFDGPIIRGWPPEKPNRLSITVNVVNGGSTWAQNFTAQIALAKIPSSERRAPFETAQWEDHPPASMILGPGQVLDLQVGDVLPGEILAVQQGMLGIYALGWIRYEDTIAVPRIQRQTQMSRQLNVDGEGGHSFGSTPTHNCADEGCP